MLQSRLLLLALVLATSMPTVFGMRFFVGTYTSDGRSSGIYSVDLDQQSGAIGTPQVAATAPNPTFLALSPDSAWLLATSEVSTGVDQAPQGGLRSFAVRPGQPLLAETGAVPIRSKGTSTHVVLSPDQRSALAVHYNAAWVASVPFDQGSLGAVASIFEHTGQVGPNVSRQDKPHAHSVTLSPDGRHAYVCDLGLDHVVVYSRDAATSKLARVSATVFPAGSGPRHSKVSADGAWVYVVNELDGTVSACSRDAATGALTVCQTVSILPENFTGANTSAEIQLHPSGRFVYASSRGPDILTVLARDPSTGRLSVLQRIASGGRHPRHFALSPDGRWLVCANRDTDNLVSFAIDSSSGLLSPTGFSAVVPQPVCVLFAP